MTVYLDNSATTRPSEPVRETVCRHMQSGWYNPSALYKPAMDVQKEMDEVRALCLKAAGAAGERIIFTSGGTGADNLALIGHMKTVRQPGRVLISSVEHPAVSACREALEALGHTVEEIPAGPEGPVDLNRLENMLDEDVHLISVMQVNNETGAIEPLKVISEMRDRKCPGAGIHVDGVQGFLRVPFSMKETGVQSYALSAHKIQGLKGTGALILKKNWRIRPLQFGGGQEENLRSGTENTFGILALGEAVKTYPADANARMAALRGLLEKLLKERVSATAVNSPTGIPGACAPHILNAAFPPVRSQTMLFALEGDGICVSAGRACASRKQKISPVLKAMGIRQETADCSLRFSLSPDTTEEEIRYTAERVAFHWEMLKKYTRR